MDLLYIRTAKTASSTVNAWIGPKTGVTFNQRFLTEPPNDIKVAKSIEYGHYLFTTVRNPFTRAISCWQQALRSSWVPRDSSFEHFLDQNFSKIDITHYKTHVLPLTEYLDPCFNKIKKFVKVEQLEKDLREIEETFGMEKRPIKAYNRGTYRTPRDGFDYKSFYTKERIELVIDKYFDDFMAFDYSKSIDF